MTIEEQFAREGAEIVRFPMDFAEYIHWLDQLIDLEYAFASPNSYLVKDLVDY